MDGASESMRGQLKSRASTRRTRSASTLNSSNIPALILPFRHTSRFELSKFEVIRISGPGHFNAMLHR